MWGFVLTLGLVYDPQRDFVFIHIPRTGGTTIEVSMSRQLGLLEGLQTNAQWTQSSNATFRFSNGVHLPDAFARRLLTRNVTSVAVLRNPLNVRLSAWRLLCQRNKYNKSFENYIRSGDFVRESLKSKRLLVGSSWLGARNDLALVGALTVPQHVFVTRCTRLFAFEAAFEIELDKSEFAEYLRKYYPALRLNIRLVNGLHAAAGASTTLEIPKHLSTTTKRIVQGAFELDFHLWSEVSRGATYLPHAPACGDIEPYAELREWQQNVLHDVQRCARDEMQCATSTFGRHLRFGWGPSLPQIPCSLRKSISKSKLDAHKLCDM
eukprot:CAMPEP_0119335382 /NCGR_PEP_ID=MMETSP1333-20130426/89465_1 /TAXON_ID=418940 /ORGANISM="Scyphosphaera apsteinii, Strain RCC1455" /LENGTH=321 /DNA_ID=CAMNT_0007345921 /DNA_START=89 /DNA_END=1054 /DNA_ORIENTATION=+